jgi:hypothetical protein
MFVRWLHGMEKKLVSFRLPEDLMHELKKQALAQGVTVTDLICEFSYDGLNGQSIESNGQDIPVSAPQSAEKPVASYDKDKVVDIRVRQLEKQVKDLRRLVDKQAQDLEKMKWRMFDELFDLLKKQQTMPQN